VGAQLRVFRRRIKSVQQTKKITKAMELIASARIVKAQARLNNAVSYTTELYSAISAAATHASDIGNHPLTARARLQDRAIYLVITADRGLAGGYSSNAIREAEGLTTLLKERGFSDIVPYVVGRKGEAYYRFRERPVAASWSGFTDQPEYHHAKEIAAALLEHFLLRTEDGGADEIHIVYTHFFNMGSQRPAVRRVLPLEVVDEEVDVSASHVGSAGDHAGAPAYPLYTFEPSPEAVLDKLLPKYVEDVVYAALLMSAASEHAARRRAMKSATDNADELIKSLSRQANAARQAEITQEISEIVGGADALASATAGS
jgi:F-type H+-transporting ATPase subunit gamma